MLCIIIFPQCSAGTQHETWCVSLCRLFCCLICVQGPQHYEEPNPSSFGHLHHAKPDGLQVARQMPYYIYNLHLDRGGHIKSGMKSAHSLLWARSDALLFALRRYYIFKMSGLHSPVEMPCEVQSVFSMEPPDSSQSPGAKRRGGRVMQSDATQIWACVQRAGTSARKTVESKRVSIKWSENDKANTHTCMKLFALMQCCYSPTQRIN